MEFSEVFYKKINFRSNRLILKKKFPKKIGKISYFLGHVFFKTKGIVICAGKMCITTFFRSNSDLAG